MKNVKVETMNVTLDEVMKYYFDGYRLEGVLRWDYFLDPIKKKVIFEVLMVEPEENDLHSLD